MWSGLQPKRLTVGFRSARRFGQSGFGSKSKFKKANLQISCHRTSSLPWMIPTWMAVHPLALQEENQCIRKGPHSAVGGVCLDQGPSWRRISETRDTIHHTAAPEPQWQREEHPAFGHSVEDLVYLVYLGYLGDLGYPGYPVIFKRL